VGGRCDCQEGAELASCQFAGYSSLPGNQIAGNDTGQLAIRRADTRGLRTAKKWDLILN